MKRIPFILILFFFAAAYAAAISNTVVELGGKRYFCLQDDAMISMRYAWNFFQGQGLVWNPGQRVQGYTNLGWTLIMSGLQWLPGAADCCALYVQILNAVLLALSAGFMYFCLRRKAGELAGLLSAVLLLFNSSVFVYSLNGFEVAMQMFLLSFSYLWLIPGQDKEQLPASRAFTLLLTAVAVLFRPDSIVFFFACAAILFYRNWKENSGQKMLNLCLVFLLSALLIAGLLAFQYFYYGSILPNTYFLKAARGGDLPWWSAAYFVSNFLLSPQFFLLLCSLIYLTQKIRTCPKQRFCAAYLIGLILVWIAYVYSVGGDTFLLGRFYIPLIPLLCACSSIFLTQWLDQKSGKSIYLPKAVLVVFLLFYLYRSFVEVQTVIKHERWKNESSILSALAVRKSGLAPQSLIAVFRAGTTPFFLPEYRFHDMLGKSDARIARTAVKWGPPGHNKWDLDYSLNEERPDLLIVAFEGMDDRLAEKLLADREPFGFTPALWLNRQFRSHYKDNKLSLPEPELKEVLDRGNPYIEDLYVRN